MTDIIPAGAPLAPDALVTEFLRGLSVNTRRAYEKDLRTFCAFVKSHEMTSAGSVSCDLASERDERRPIDAVVVTPSIGYAAQTLLAHGSHAAALLALRWRDSMTASGLSPATVNRRLAALRSLVELGRSLGLVEWDLRVKGLKRQPYRDVRGPERSVYLAAVAKAGVRDAAILRLLGDRGLRRGTIVDLDVADFDAERRTLKVRLKGKRAEPESVTLAAATSRALSRWIAVRGAEPGPLFPGRDGRIEGETIRVLTHRHGLGHPHGLRHSAITAGLDATNGNIRDVQRFAGHAKVETTIRYDDARRDLAGGVANLVAAPEPSGE